MLNATCEKKEKIHEKAEKWKSMSDEQLFRYIENRVEKARSEGFNKGTKSASAVNGFIADVEQIREIDESTIAKIKEFYQKRGIIRIH